LFRVWLAHIQAFLVCFSVFSTKMAEPALRLSKPCLSPSLTLGKKYRLIGPFFGLFVSFQMILFCVCLAHARQQGLGTPVATGVAFQAAYLITEKALRAADDIPLDGAKVSIKGQQNTVLTNAEGLFRILAGDSGVLLISYVGYGRESRMPCS
jgi:hypothetical protein